ncbi:tyrosine-type recombinase/integrase [Bradyrhizobium japonicum]|uniref:tyrosine-type recombinase/integrase n=1 Tax=Bradyrhizobium japonicum TaxID=375 RepID=UPI001E46294B|nr:tyrosine-type recombinase/integrase [Bradyrhizobium japonicum]MCD9110099.1 tyrosine-type recombinase/integrase [Bradyrhizobium japonicum]MCD9817069.1 tyrosine-type recombinase/integrase [Bradyrhizobium japonicum]MCD9891721.1 tyrosine-type recombinase/integrase [Bradyrhizobium japonicum]MCS3982678.1 integrase [Bradyrhizobium japonicum]MEB2670731.1 tyrosine-type recombinase/integrase [Bradyrhizobium japonicum]
MPKPRSSALESATSRRKLAIRKKPYWLKLSPGIALGFRRNEGPGTWTVRSTDGHGRLWEKRLALADDLEAAAPPHVLTFWDAQKVALALARKQPHASDEGRPLTVAEALDHYAEDLKARGGAVSNVGMPRKHLSSMLLSRPVMMLGAAELKLWRDNLIGGRLQPASINRMLKSLRAALSLAARLDPRIQNAEARRIGLQALPDADRDRNVILPDDQVSELVAAAYAHDRALGLYVDTLAVTGARPSQAARLTVADLITASAKAPRLMMPKSGKGRSPNRAARKIERTPVAITPALAALLKQASKGRDGGEPLLLQADGRSWGERPSENYRDAVREIVASIGLNAETVTLYATRHSSIVRQLLAGVPIRVCAVAHDTSVSAIEKHYSRFVAHHADEITRAALLHHEPRVGNVVALR